MAFDRRPDERPRQHSRDRPDRKAWPASGRGYRIQHRLARRGQKIACLSVWLNAQKWVWNRYWMCLALWETKVLFLICLFRASNTPSGMISCFRKALRSEIFSTLSAIILSSSDPEEITADCILLARFPNLLATSSPGDSTELKSLSYEPGTFFGLAPRRRAMTIIRVDRNRGTCDCGSGRPPSRKTTPPPGRSPDRPHR